MEQRITSRKNPQIQMVRKLLSSRKYREETGRFVGDGIKLLKEASAYCPGLETVFLSDGVEADLPETVQVIRVPEDVMESISPMSSPQGALFVCRMPRQPEWKPRGGMMILDGIQDPGNLGTILRTSDALDVPLVLLEGCADVFNHKVVRASMGAVFRREVVQTTWEQVLQACKAAQIPIGVTALSDTAMDIRRAQLHTMAVVIGSEGQGVRPEILEQADQKLIIPMNAHCESLNAAVAATIVMWQMRCTLP